MPTTPHIALELIADGLTSGWGTDYRANLTKIDTELKRLSDIIDATPSAANPVAAAYPVGAIFIATVATNPATLLGFGTWAAFAEGRCLVGVGTADGLAWTSEQTRGNVDQTLTVANLPAHTHTVAGLSAAAAGTHSHGVGSLEVGGVVMSSGSPLNAAVSYILDNSFDHAFDAGTGTSPIQSHNGAYGGTDHHHTLSGTTASGGSHTHDVTGTIDSTGDDESFRLLQPSIGVYMWKRTA